MQIVLGETFPNRSLRTVSPHWCSEQAVSPKETTKKKNNYILAKLVRSTVNANDEVPCVLLLSSIALSTSGRRSPEGRGDCRHGASVLDMRRSDRTLHGEHSIERQETRWMMPLGLDRNGVCAQIAPECEESGRKVATARIRLAAGIQNAGVSRVDAMWHSETTVRVCDTYFVVHEVNALLSLCRGHTVKCSSY